MTLTGHQAPVTSVAFSPDGRRLAAASADENIRLWAVASGQLLAELPNGHRDRVIAIAFIPDSALLTAGTKDHAIRLWDALTA